MDEGPRNFPFAWCFRALKLLDCQVAFVMERDILRERPVGRIPIKRFFFFFSFFFLSAHLKISKHALMGTKRKKQKGRQVIPNNFDYTIC